MTSPKERGFGFNELTPAELAEVHVYIGRILVRLPQAAAFARHRRPMDTLRDYVDIDPADSKTAQIAKEYLKDLFGRSWGNSTEELVARWHYEPEPEIL